MGEDGSPTPRQSRRLAGLAPEHGLEDDQNDPQDVSAMGSSRGGPNLNWDSGVPERRFRRVGERRSLGHLLWMIVKSIFGTPDVIDTPQTPETNFPLLHAVKARRREGDPESGYGLTLFEFQDISGPGVPLDWQGCESALAKSMTVDLEARKRWAVYGAVAIGQLIQFYHCVDGGDVTNIKAKGKYALHMQDDSGLIMGQLNDISQQFIEDLTRDDEADDEEDDEDDGGDTGDTGDTGSDDESDGDDDDDDNNRRAAGDDGPQDSEDSDESNALRAVSGRRPAAPTWLVNFTPAASPKSRSSKATPRSTPRSTPRKTYRSASGNASGDTSEDAAGPTPEDSSITSADSPSNASDDSSVTSEDPPSNASGDHSEDSSEEQFGDDAGDDSGDSSGGDSGPDNGDAWGPVGDNSGSDSGDDERENSEENEEHSRDSSPDPLELTTETGDAAPGDHISYHQGRFRMVIRGRPRTPPGPLSRPSAEDSSPDPLATALEDDSSHVESEADPEYVPESSACEAQPEPDADMNSPQISDVRMLSPRFPLDFNMAGNHPEPDLESLEGGTVIFPQDILKSITGFPRGVARHFLDVHPARENERGSTEKQGAVRGSSWPGV
ncbi:hypothetical protein BO70DRAFT_361164 [Aspergillus heteromorphus CBS 117.55]|uniref:Uncharacterized protein n=1 Tax=Aspergillus heteromorphus CBS 117.55 TaxID=1448321 RepID=A0A317WKN0_9EURO|nr:uncharacterized protein BO70DRAFT_361164 [Aspergillus heteromorphus CBS 117.55]PWY84760.1 hypothetical protein BO70DRAFT_361164 [Aspergillus heteromorphus CBS 117.55]